MLPEAWLKTLGFEFFRSLNGLILLFVLFIPLERLFPLQAGLRIFRTGFISDVTYYFSRIITSVILLVPFGLIAWGLSKLPLQTFHGWVGSWPFWLKLSAGLVVGEIGAYWAHRLMHEVPSLWRFHAIHHSAEEMDWLVNVRVHPVETVWIRCFQFVPLYLFGLIQPSAGDSGLLILLIPLIGAVWGYFIHSNVRLRFGPLEWLITTPAFHHWHHTNDDPSLHNKNYSFVLPWVDLLFGSFYLPRGKVSKSYGIAEKVPQGFIPQFLHGFQAPRKQPLPGPEPGSDPL